jgi:hypothetical protein
MCADKKNSSNFPKRSSDLPNLSSNIPNPSSRAQLEPFRSTKHFHKPLPINNLGNAFRKTTSYLSFTNCRHHPHVR